VSTKTSARSHGHRILVIDDDEIALQSISDVLEEAGYRVHGMVSPIGATQVIATQDIQAAVIDLNMPIMRGDRLVSMIRGWDRIRDLPVVLISGASTATLDEVGAQLPGVQMVTKDSMRKALAPAVARALQTRVERVDAGTTQRVSKDDVALTFLKNLPKQSSAVLEAWNDVLQKRAAPETLHALLSNTRAQAQISGLTPLAKLLSTVVTLSEHCARAKSYSSEMQSAMSSVFAFLQSAGTEKGGAAAISAKVSPYLTRLERIQETLR
jgi:CheY-like chemotaxis protein